MTSRYTRTRIAPGSTIGIIAPAGPVDGDALAAGIERLKTRYGVKCAPMQSFSNRTHYLADKDAQRLAALHWALDDPEVKVILASRGGYGAMRILNEDIITKVADTKKLLVGFSDITALHALWSKANVASVHGTMAGGIHQMDDDAWQKWIDALESDPINVTCDNARVIVEGEARGKLVGGNLSILAALAATPFAPAIDGCLLALEDVHEAPYRVDRMLTTLRLAGWWNRIAGVIFGQFTDVPSGADSVTVHDVICEHFGGWDRPVLDNLPFGHIDDNTPLVFGAPMVLTARRARSMLFSA